MKVLDLRCPHDHHFEGWFASEDDYQAQQTRGLVSCPVCGAAEVTRLPSAPRLIVSRSREVTVAADKPASAAATMHAVWQKAVRHVLENTVDVGPRFPEEARRMHYGETEERAIRGQASPAEAQALRDEGIDIVTLPLGDPDKSTLQ